MEDIREYQRDEREHLAEPMLITKRRSIDLQPAVSETAPQPDSGFAAVAAADDADETMSAFPPMPSLPANDDDDAEFPPIPQPTADEDSGRRRVSMEMTECVDTLLTTGTLDGEMEMTQCLDEVFEQPPAAGATAVPVTAPTGRRQSTAMDMTECVDTLALASGTSATSEPAARLTDDESDEMEMTGCYGDMLEAATMPTVAALPVHEEPAQVDMEMTQCYGGMLARAPSPNTTDAHEPQQSDDDNKTKAQVFEMDMTEAVGGMIERAVGTVPVPHSFASAEEDDGSEMDMTQTGNGVIEQAMGVAITGPDLAASVHENTQSQPRRESMAMDMTACVGTLLYESPSSSPEDNNNDNNDDDDGMQMTQAHGGIIQFVAGTSTGVRRQSVAMDMTESIANVVEDREGQAAAVEVEVDKEEEEEESTPTEKNAPIPSVLTTATVNIPSPQLHHAVEPTTREINDETLPAVGGIDVGDANEADEWPAQNDDDGDLVGDDSFFAPAPSQSDAAAVPTATAEASVKADAVSHIAKEQVVAHMDQQDSFPGYENAPVSELLLRANVRFLDKVSAGGVLVVPLFCAACLHFLARPDHSIRHCVLLLARAGHVQTPHNDAWPCLPSTGDCRRSVPRRRVLPAAAQAF